MSSQPTNLFDSITQRINDEKNKSTTTQEIKDKLDKLLSADTELNTSFNELIQFEKSLFERPLTELAKELVKLQEIIILKNCKTLLELESPQKASVKKLVEGLTNKVRAMNELMNEKFK